MTRNSRQNPRQTPLRNPLRTPLLLSAGLSAALLAANVQADSTATSQSSYQNDYASKEETVGFFSGALLGGLAGGPPGAILGAAIGAFAGDGQQARSRNNELQAELLTARLESDRLRDTTRELQEQYQIAMAELDQLRSTRARTLPAYLPGSDAVSCCGDTAISIHFRTGSSVIEGHYREQLEGIAKLAQQMPTAAIEITGYADRNGDGEKNLQLSRQRSAEVKNYLNAHGIDDASIVTLGYGENNPLYETQSMETDFFDRRVTVRIRDTSESLLSQSPDGN